MFMNLCRARLLSIALVGSISVGAPQMARAAWIDSATGQPVQTNPVTGNTLVSEGDHNGTVGGMTDKDHAFLPHTGQSLYWDQACGTWRDAKNGQEVKTNPVTGDTLVSEGDHNGTVGAMSDPDHAFLPHTGQNLHWVPCPPPSTDVNTSGPPVGPGKEPPQPPTPPSPSPTHRTTSCDRCQKTADRLNKASDQLAQDLSDPSVSPATIADDRSLVKDYSKMLDDCEKHCKDSGGLLDHVTIGVGVDVGGGHDHGDDHHDHHSDHSDAP